MTDDRISMLEARVQQLEGVRRRMLWVGAPCLCACLVAMLSSWAQDTGQSQDPGVVRARRYELVESKGRLRADLLPKESETVEAETALALYNAEGKVGILFTAGSQESHVEMT